MERIRVINSVERSRGRNTNRSVPGRGARPSGRFNLKLRVALIRPVNSELQEKKRRERRAPVCLAPLCASALLLLATTLLAAEAPATSTNPAPVYNAARSFAQPIRPDPVGTNITVNRAYWGAPPPMPHSFPRPQDDGRACLECHARETRIEKRQQAIVPVPHAEFSQCQQCHVPQTGDLVELGTAVENFRPTTFVGLDHPGKGTRAHPYAPPTIPHKTFMRDNCLSCHGPTGKQKIATPHPYRSQCQQCHVSDASKNYDRPLPWTELKGEF